MPKWLLAFVANELLPAALSNSPCASVIDAGIFHFSIIKNYILFKFNCSFHSFPFLFGYVSIFAFNNVSLAEKKENFEKLNNALEIIKNTDIYKFNYKKEKRNKKHIGLVIGNKYNYSKELTNEENNAVDLYSMVGVCLQAIKEQQKEIEEFKNEIKNLKESDK